MDLIQLKDCDNDDDAGNHLKRCISCYTNNVSTLFS